MKKIGLTGGIGSGKTFVSQVFRTLGVPVFHSDDVARDLQDTDQKLKDQISALLGDVYSPDGKLDRRKVAEMVFSNRDLLDKLNSIVHPAVAAAFDRFCTKHSSAPYVIKEAAIIFEMGLEKQLDGVILVTAPLEVRVKRVMDRDKLTEEEVKRRIGNQWSEEKKVELANWTVNNDGASSLIPQAMKIHSDIKSK